MDKEFNCYYGRPSVSEYTRQTRRKNRINLIPGDRIPVRIPTSHLTYLLTLLTYLFTYIFPYFIYLLTYVLTLLIYLFIYLFTYLISYLHHGAESFSRSLQILS